MEIQLLIQDGMVSCPLKGDIVAYDYCLDCPWLIDYSLESPEPLISCQPAPVNRWVGSGKSGL